MRLLRRAVRAFRRALWLQMHYGRGSESRPFWWRVKMCWRKEQEYEQWLEST